MKQIKISQLPKDVLKKAEIVGNIFDEIKRLKRALETIDKIASINNEDEKNQVLNDIYRIAHAFSCRGCSHPDWIEFENEMAEKLKDY